ncbi:MAG: hypothetical protein PHU03_02710, partial [Syntrophales bacterium]|nr:hypothetical protein [Syntrophales bacterium]
CSSDLYIHFNFTPNQDKATASLIGDVPRGVMLRERPIFLGGQGGIVGPLRIGYGTVVAAGTILREDLDDGCLYSGAGSNRLIIKPFHEGLYGNPDRIINNNIEYIGNIIALKSWYRHVRRNFFHDLDFGPALYEGAMETLNLALSERINRLGVLAEKMGRYAENPDRISSSKDNPATVESQNKFRQAWPDFRDFLATAEEENMAEKERHVFLGAFEKSPGQDYLEAISGLEENTAALGTAWLAATTKWIKENAQVILRL